MIVLTSFRQMQEWSRQQHMAGKTVAFVPTMGYLHQGHLSLVDLAKERADHVVVSIFVNPTQFGPGEDYDTYPRDEEADLQKCEEHDVSVVFLPSVEEMYPAGYKTYITVEDLGKYLCGASRPNHFRGVTTIVAKLFNVVLPDVAIFGQKDAQQARIIEQLTADLQFPIEIVRGPIVRETDGLAMSSRNVRLKPEHRKQAPTLHRSLTIAQDLFKDGVRNSGKLAGAVRNKLNEQAPDGVIDYIEVADWKTLEPVDSLTGPALLAIAVKFGNVRLIDNTLLG